MMQMPMWCVFLMQVDIDMCADKTMGFGGRDLQAEGGRSQTLYGGLQCIGRAAEIDQGPKDHVAAGTANAVKVNKAHA